LSSEFHQCYRPAVHFIKKNEHGGGGRRGVGHSYSPLVCAFRNELFPG
jgi:hypothetical protein